MTLIQATIGILVAVLFYFVSSFIYISSITKEFNKTTILLKDKLLDLLHNNDSLTERKLLLMHPDILLVNKLFKLGMTFSSRHKIFFQYRFYDVKNTWIKVVYKFYQVEVDDCVKLWNAVIISNPEEANSLFCQLKIKHP